MAEELVMTKETTPKKVAFVSKPYTQKERLEKDEKALEELLKKQKEEPAAEEVEKEEKEPENAEEKSFK